MSLKMVCLSLSLLNKVVNVITCTDKIAYIYSSAGVKVQKRVTEGGVVTLTDYLEGFQYVGGALSFLPTAEGFFTAETNAYVYQYRDHLGNVRLSYSDKNENNIIEANEIIEEMNYYPFGLAHKGYNEKNDALMQDYKYGYNGKESQEELGLNYYDYGARHYDAAIGRWMSVDPLAEQTMTPYQYVYNNPIMFTDPTGMAGESIVVGNSVKENHVTNQALNTFAQTEEGKSFLADYAKKGDVVGGHTFGKDGKYHNKGIDISFEAKDLGDNVRGTTSSSVDGDRANIAFTINSDLKVTSQDGSTYDTANYSVSNTDNIVKGILSRTITIFHETFMHGVHSTQDYLDDNTFNKSNIDSRIKSHYKNTPKHFGHAQAQFGSDASSLLFNTKGLNGIKSANSIWSSGKHYNAGQLHKMMWNFTGSYK